MIALQYALKTGPSVGALFTVSSGVAFIVSSGLFVLDLAAFAAFATTLFEFAGADPHAHNETVIKATAK